MPLKWRASLPHEGECWALFSSWEVYLLSLSRLVVVHFWAPWSQPCKQMNDVMAELAEEHATVKFIKVCVCLHNIVEGNSGGVCVCR